jgi:hypothetical protein
VFTVNLQPAVLFQFDFFQPLPIHIQVADAPLTSDVGLLPLRQFDQNIGLTKQFAAVLDDPRDAVFKLIAERSPTDADLASQPTLSRFENQINISSLKRLRQVFVNLFIDSFAQPPLSLTFDLDAVDDPAHGSQQLTLFHAFYQQYQYLPLVITTAETRKEYQNDRP